MENRTKLGLFIGSIVALILVSAFSAVLYSIGIDKGVAIVKDEAIEQANNFGIIEITMTKLVFENGNKTALLVVFANYIPIVRHNGTSIPAVDLRGIDGHGNLVEYEGETNYNWENRQILYKDLPNNWESIELDVRDMRFTVEPSEIPTLILYL